MFKNRIVMFAFAIVIAAFVPGCGGGGGGTAVAPSAVAPAGTIKPQPGNGKIAAVVRFAGIAARGAGSTPATVNVTITISGIYSATGKEFAPVTTTYPINTTQGYARVSLTEVPTGVNHLLTATADWGGTVETVKAIIPAVEKDEITSVTADAASTAVAAAALLYASNKSVTLSEVSDETIAAISSAVASYSAQAAYSSMTAEGVLSFMAAMGIPASVSLSPATASLMIGETLQLTGAVLDGNGMAVASATLTWSSQGAAGTLSSSGLFTAAAEGTASVAATYQGFSATASISVVKVCQSVTECNDGNALTLDACDNPGTLSASCSHTAFACNTAADCDDANSYTIDSCTAGGTVSAACGNAPVACFTVMDCDDMDNMTIDECTNGGTVSAVCGHTPVACFTVADCDDGNSLTIDECTNGGTAGSACVNTPIACNTAADCSDGNPNTIEYCYNGGTVAAACSNVRWTGDIAAGSSHACMVMPDTTVQCWGNNGNGQVGNGAAITQQVLGRKAGPAPRKVEKRESGRTANYVWVYGTENYVLEPATVVNLTGAIQVTAGDWHTCALLNTGAIKCWGSNNESTLGDDTTVDSSTPVDVIGITDAVQISTSNDHTCALLAGGTIKCWGWNSDGCLGDGTINQSGIPLDVAGVTGAIQVSAGGWDTCALLDNGTVKCWGEGYDGELGDGLSTSSLAPVDVVGITTAIAISAGADQTCALLADGTVQCWGANGNGELGDGTGVSSPVPVAVPGITNAVQVSSGANHVCALIADGTAYCWGLNMSEELGNNDNLTALNIMELSPVPVNVISGQITGISTAVRGAYTCFTLAAGGFKCVGDGSDGQFADGRASYETTPISEFGLTSVVAYDQAGHHACAVLPDGTLTCFGQNGPYALLGDGRDTGWQRPVTGAAGITGAVGYAAGDEHNCVLTDSQTVQCWGRNLYGQLGQADSQYIDSTSPLNVPGLTGITALSAGANFTCALDTAGAIKCWGLGAGDTPVDVPGITGAVNIDSEATSSCALMPDSTLMCWGDNQFGQLGDGTLNTTSTPVYVSDGLGGNLTGAAAVTTGTSHTCALMLDGTIKCWGDNTHGQFGDGNTGTSSPYPVDVPGVTNAMDVAAGDSFTCAALASGGVKCWGYNNYYTLGNGDASGVDQPLPVDVSGITDASKVYAGRLRACALSASRGLLCWGNDLYYNNW